MTAVAANLTQPVGFDAEAVRRDFPILSLESRGRPLVYLDNGATTQKPRVVIDALRNYYEKQNANIHRGVYELSQIATEGYERARRIVQRFINAADPAEIIFTRGTTESINLVASSFGRAFLSAGDEVVVSALEHHSNIVPWQMICQQTGAKLRVIPMNDRGELLLEEFAAMLNSRIKIVAVTHLSNSLGTVVPVEQIIQMAHSVGGKVLIDGAQWVAHAPTDVRAIGADFYVFSGHKLFSPTGIGVLYGRRELLDAMPPYQGGGDMIEQVTFGKTTYAPLPNKFEAGTPNIAGAIGLSYGIEYLERLGLDAVRAYERELHAYLDERLAAIKGVRIVGTAKHKASVVSFVVDEPRINLFELGRALDVENVAIRVGHHCCQPVMDRLGIGGTARASIAVYNSRNDVDRLCAAIEAVMESERLLRRQKIDASDVVFLEASGASPAACEDELAEEFSFFDDTNAKTEYLRELGEKLPKTIGALRQITERVVGCMSEVYVLPRIRQGTTDVVEFAADAEDTAWIVRGLIVVLSRLYSGQRAQEILEHDIAGFMTRIGLESFVTTQRRSGFEGLIRRVRQFAQQTIVQVRGQG